ncbi:MAG: hypothetical protein KTQ49_00835 [Candidatus Omnitrophica bacterium]|nr:hypothetical protein [Candidatus Omnitrophota bacterium]
MPKLFRGAFWVGVTAFVTDMAARINRNPRAVRIAVLVLLNLAGFFCFWIILYGLGLLLVPSPGHEDYKLMRFGVRFVSLVMALLLSIGLYNLIRGIALAGRYVSDKISGVGQGLKKGGTVAIEVPKAVVDAAGRAVEGSVELARKAGKGLEAGVKRGAELFREKAPEVGGAVSVAVRKTGEAVKTSSKRTADWSKENVPKAVRGIKAFVAAAILKAASLWKLKKGPRETKAAVPKERAGLPPGHGGTAA